MPRLPIPNLSISTTQPLNGYGGYPATQLPLPTGRAMSMAYPGQMGWSQPGIVPTSAGPIQPSPQNYALSPFSEQPRRQSPYAMPSAISSPTSAGFPVHTPGPTHLSPSYFLAQRNSPYRPVRSVNTLLVPPPSASQNPHHLAFDQMHYQTLGKSLNERKTGVVPYLQQDTWSQPAPQWPSLPQPSFQG